MIIYTTGYSGTKAAPGVSKVQALKQTVLNLDATLLDIRFSPNSIAPCWRKHNLEKLLGDRYRHIPELGNRNYRNGKEIEIVDMAGGVEQILAAGPKPVILLCGCEDYAACHRGTVGDYLRDNVEGVEAVIEILRWDGSKEEMLAETNQCLEFIAERKREGKETSV